MQSNEFKKLKSLLVRKSDGELDIPLTNESNSAVLKINPKNIYSELTKIFEDYHIASKAFREFLSIWDEGSINAYLFDDQLATKILYLTQDGGEALLNGSSLEGNKELGSIGNFIGLLVLSQYNTKWTVKPLDFFLFANSSKFLKKGSSEFDRLFNFQKFEIQLSEVNNKVLHDIYELIKQTKKGEAKQKSLDHSPGLLPCFDWKYEAPREGKETVSAKKAYDILFWCSNEDKLGMNYSELEVVLDESSQIHYSDEVFYLFSNPLSIKVSNVGPVDVSRFKVYSSFMEKLEGIKLGPWTSEFFCLVNTGFKSLHFNQLPALNYPGTRLSESIEINVKLLSKELLVLISNFESGVIQKYTEATNKSEEVPSSFDFLQPKIFVTVTVEDQKEEELDLASFKSMKIYSFSIKAEGREENLSSDSLKQLVENLLNNQNLVQLMLDDKIFSFLSEGKKNCLLEQLKEIENISNLELYDDPLKSCLINC